MSSLPRRGGIVVQLGPDEAAVARLIGEIRAESCVLAGTPHKHFAGDADGEVVQHQHAAGAEIAVAKLLNRWPQAWGSVGAANALGDVAGHQVRWTGYDNGHLICRGGEDDPAQAFILVTGALSFYIVRGWLRGAEVMRDDWLCDEYLPALVYMGPQDRLRPISTLGWLP